MTRRFDPLDSIPSADIVRRKLQETETTAAKLRILLEVAERVEAAVYVEQPRENLQPTASAEAPPMIAQATPTTNGVRHRIRNATVRKESADENAENAAGVICGATLYTAATFGRLLGLGRWGVRNLRAAGLPARKIAGKTFILGDEALAWFQSLPAAPAPKRIRRRERVEN